LDEFAHSHSAAPGHATASILACQVGSEGSVIAIPPALRWIQRQLGDELYLPDLRNVTQQPPRKRRIEAAALLAPIIGLNSREEVLARVRKRRIQLAATGFAAFVLAFVVLFLWIRWLATPEGAYYSAAETVLSSATRREIVAPELITAARAFGTQNQRTKVEKLSLFIREKQFRAVVRAAGLASLPRPDCASAAILLKGVDHAAVLTWPQGHLVTFHACGGSWLDRARRADLPSDLPGWFDRLVSTGNLAQAQQVLSDPDYPKDELLPGHVKLALASRMPTIYQQSEVAEWLKNGTVDSLDVLYQGLALLRSFDLANRLSDRLANQLGTICFQATSTLDVNIANNWTMFNQLAGHLSGMGSRNEATRLLNLKPRRDPLGNPGWAPGWIWRGLAFQRLHDVSRCSRFIFSR
jgi:hypothetical protein